jgi:hypothetical protein
MHATHAPNESSCATASAKSARRVLYRPENGPGNNAFGRSEASAQNSHQQERHNRLTKIALHQNQRRATPNTVPQIQFPTQGRQRFNPRQVQKLRHGKTETGNRPGRFMQLSFQNKDINKAYRNQQLIFLLSLALLNCGVSVRFRYDIP